LAAFTCDGVVIALWEHSGAIGEVLHMSWERRGGQWVCYRARRVNGRVVKDYYGRGDVAEFAAAAHLELREDRRSKLEEQQAERGQLWEADAALETLHAETNAAVRQVLTAVGYHQHKRGEWRRARG
jgi:hypothetical protein